MSFVSHFSNLIKETGINYWKSLSNYANHAHDDWKNDDDQYQFKKLKKFIETNKLITAKLFYAIPYSKDKNCEFKQTILRDQSHFPDLPISYQHMALTPLQKFLISICVGAITEILPNVVRKNDFSMVEKSQADALAYIKNMREKADPGQLTVPGNVFLYEIEFHVMHSPILKETIAGASGYKCTLMTEESYYNRKGDIIL